MESNYFFGEQKNVFCKLTANKILFFKYYVITNAIIGLSIREDGLHTS